LLCTRICATLGCTCNCHGPCDVYADRNEFCQFDTFEADCDTDEVIIIETAHYGRMRAGRCIAGEGYIGCSADVRVYLDGHCSGRRQCAVQVASLTDIVQPCRRDFTSYLEASYNCIKGLRLIRRLCLFYTFHHRHNHHRPFISSFIVNHVFVPYVHTHKL